MDGHGVDDASVGHLLAQVSNAMVRIYKEDFGRGPTRSVSHFAGPDAIICVLRDSLTRAELRLVEIGEVERMRETRLVFQHASEERFRGAVEEITGRRVEAFVSGIDGNVDVSLEYFALAPQQNGDTRGA
jgi:uncharacterized protein YbcI